MNEETGRAEPADDIRHLETFWPLAANLMVSRTSALVGYSELVLSLGSADHLKREEWLRLVIRIGQAVDDFARRIEKVASIGSLDTGDTTVIDTSILFEQSIEKALRRSPQRNIRFLVENDAHVLGVEPALSDALAELVSNAIRFSPADGEVRIAALLTPDSGRVAIHVDDDGIGMSQSDLQRLFNPFPSIYTPEERQLDDSALCRGLGLYLAHRLVQSMNGAILVQSEEGKGSRFTIVLPAPPKSDASI